MNGVVWESSYDAYFDSTSRNRKSVHEVVYDMHETMKPKNKSIYRGCHFLTFTPFQP
jgi:hypothetical protein